MASQENKDPFLKRYKAEQRARLVWGGIAGVIVFGLILYATGGDSPAAAAFFSLLGAGVAYTVVPFLDLR